MNDTINKKNAKILEHFFQCNLQHKISKLQSDNFNTPKIIIIVSRQTFFKETKEQN